jgi:anaerobic selenocysteine-containing dehydrogenase
MGYREPELHEPDHEVIEELLRRAGVGLDFAELARRGTVWLDEQPRPQFADLRFPTPSGRVEIASALAEADGQPRVPVPFADPRPQDGRLRLLSPASPWILNDSFANDPKITWRIGPATVALHPDDAAERGLAEGDRAVLESGTGELALTVALSDALPRGVAYSPKGRWPKRTPEHANVNVLNPGTPSDMGASTTVHGLEVTVRRQTEVAS